MLKTVAASVAGLALVGFILWFYDIREIASAFAAVGFALLPLIAARAAAIALVGVAWRYLAGVQAPALQTFIALRVVREGVNNLLPVAQVGGEIVGARLLAKAGLPGARAGATVLVDMLLQVGTQMIFAVVGICLLVWQGTGSAIAWSAAAATAVGLLAVAGFFFAQRHGLALIDTFLKRQVETNNWSFIGSVADLNLAVQEIWRDRLAVVRSFTVHLATWFFGAVEVWIVMSALGIPITLAEALVIESLGHAVRGAAFAVPGALGVQEGGFIALCAIYGIAAPAAIVLSLAKRVPDLVIGIPGLLIWYRWEARSGAGRSASSS